MASEIGIDLGPGLTGITAYGMLRNASQQVWNTAGSAFEAFNAANIADYDIALTEQGSTGYFVGDMPAVSAGLYTLTVKQQAGGSPAVSDTRIGGGEGDWNGTTFQSVANISSRIPTSLVSGRIDASVGAMAANTITAAATAADYITEVQTAITGGAYDLDTDANGRIRIVDGTGTGEIDTTSGGVLVAALAANSITAAASAADFVTEVQSGLATAASIAALNNLSAAQVNAEVVDALATDTYAEPGQGAPGTTISLAAKINWLYASWRNLKTNDGTTTKLYADDGTTIIAKQTTSESGGTVSKAEWITGA